MRGARTGSATSAPLSWGRVAVSAYLPTLLSSVGFGAVIPLIPLTALHLGSSQATAAFVTSLVGIGQILGDVPAGRLVTRFGEKWALVAAMVLDAAALAAMGLASSTWWLAVAVLVNGACAATFGIARQTYLTEAVPYRLRARALSSLGGVFRVGWLIGPLLGAWILHHGSMRWAYAAASGFAVVGAAVTTALPDLPAATPTDEDSATQPAERGPSTWQVVVAHWPLLLTRGAAVAALMVVRSARQSLLPLWCHTHGIDPATTDLVFAASMSADVLLFLPGGWLMDRFGRWWVAVPSLAVQALALALLPAAHSLAPIVAVAVLLGLGNGTSSGIVMTLGSDASPARGRPQFLAAWRVMADSGSALGPVVVTLVTLVGPLGAASLVLSGIGALGTWGMARWVPRGRVVTSSPDAAEDAVTHRRRERPHYDEES